MQRHKGFSLLEILIAFAIMAVAITIVLRIFGSGVNNSVISEEYTLGMQLAESLWPAQASKRPCGRRNHRQGSQANTTGAIIISAAAQSNPYNSQNSGENQDKPPPHCLRLKSELLWGRTIVADELIELNSLKTL